jgi:transposase
VVEELERIGADVHLAESAETRGLKGRKQRAKTDWADARHLRELLLIGRLPESGIAPAHLLDLRARVRCRHTLVEQRTEWQRRMHAVLYHHGCPNTRKLLTLANRQWIAGLTLPAAAREQLAIALEMIDAIEIQLGPVDLALRTYARQQPGCRTLIENIYGIGELTSVTILAELGDPRRFQNSRDAVRYSGLDITVYQSKQPRPPVLPASRRADRRQPRVHRGRAQAPEAQLPPPARTRRPGPPACRRLSTPTLSRGKPEIIR